MYTRTLVGKLACGHLGDRDIGDIDDAYDLDAVALKARYTHARDMVYTMHDWKWAKRSVELQRLPVTPALRFTYAYALPPYYAMLSNVARDVPMRDTIDDQDFDISDGRFNTDAEYVFMDYVANDWSEAVWPPYFADCVALNLAEICCLKLTHDINLKQTLKKMLMQTVLPEARAIDSTGQPFKRKLIRSPWQESRLGRFGTSNLRRNA